MEQGQSDRPVKGHRSQSRSGIGNQYGSKSFGLAGRKKKRRKREKEAETDGGTSQGGTDREFRYEDEWRSEVVAGGLPVFLCHVREMCRSKECIQYINAKT
ncbi:hypothetical protein Baya_13734 [Bagarius yarrelli]|uniref:Uncharacterized protein n=1 Tax=Bagarius yarrelli TaxID=175774 RepID=A0A556V6X4_BAGYA|nr:hypothetical protein Baya_13734 [Bagarius yarrelli]